MSKNFKNLIISNLNKINYIYTVELLKFAGKKILQITFLNVNKILLKLVFFLAGYF